MANKASSLNCDSVATSAESGRLLRKREKHCAIMMILLCCKEVSIA